MVFPGQPELAPLDSTNNRTRLKSNVASFRMMWVRLMHLLIVDGVFDTSHKLRTAEHIGTNSRTQLKRDNTELIISSLAE